MECGDDVMSDIDFQNGFIVGLATKGLVRSGNLYEPLCWNDEGVYDYFYIDFRRKMEEFSLGMFSQSIIVHDSVQLAVTDVTYVSPGVYKVLCNISNKLHGITVINKKTSLLAFSSGEQLPVFSTHFYVAGIDAYINLKYIYEETSFEQYEPASTLETVGDLDLWTALDVGGISESITYASYEPTSVSEAPSVILT